METADTPANAAFFGRPRNRPGQTVAYPQLRVAALIESGTHVIVDAEIGTYHTGEVELSQQLVRYLRPGMPLLADRGFPGVRWWKQMSATGAELLCRVQKGWKLLPERVLEDGSWISTVQIRVRKGTPKTGRESVTVRVIEYRLNDTGRDPDRHYRLVTTLTEPRQAPAAELAALYAERWEVENTLAELKTSQIGHDHPLPSKSPELVRQEIWAHLAVHAALRALIWRTATAREQPLDCDRFSFTAALRSVRRSVLTPTGAFPPADPEQALATLARELLEEINPPRRLRSVIRQIKRMLPKYPAWRADRPQPPQPQTTPRPSRRAGHRRPPSRLISQRHWPTAPGFPAGPRQ